MQLELTTGQRLDFDRHGEQNDPAIVLLHGLSSNRHSYDRVVGHLLAAGGWQILNVDLRGHGASAHATPDSYRATVYASDVAALLDTVLRVEGAVAPAVVVGHSLGGVVAGALRAARPDLVRALFREDPPYFEGDDAVRNASPVASFFPRFVAAIRTLQARSAPAAEFEALIAATTAAEDVAAQAAGLRSWDPATMEAAVAGLVWHGFDPEAAVACPLTILQADPACGGVFKIEDGPRVTARNPHARIVLMRGATHGVHGAQTLTGYLDQLDRFLGALAA